MLYGVTELTEAVHGHRQRRSLDLLALGSAALACLLEPEMGKETAAFVLRLVVSNGHLPRRCSRRFCEIGDGIVTPAEHERRAFQRFSRGLACQAACG